MTHARVFLLDVDNTLLDRDHVIDDLAGADLPDLLGPRPAHLPSKDTQ